MKLTKTGEVARKILELLDSEGVVNYEALAAIKSAEGTINAVILTQNQQRVAEAVIRETIKKLSNTNTGDDGGNKILQ